MGNKHGKQRAETKVKDIVKEYEICFLQGRMSAMEIKEKLEEEDPPVEAIKKDGGIAYFVELAERAAIPAPPTRLLNRPRISNRGNDEVYDTDEKQLIADILQQETVSKRGIATAMREERHNLARERRQEMLRQKKERHDARMRAMAESCRRRDELLNNKRITTHSKPSLVSSCSYAFEKRQSSMSCHSS